MTITPLRLPKVRESVRDALEDLADAEMQEELWQDGKPHPLMSQRYSLNEIVHTISDHVNPLGEYASDMVGDSLRSIVEFRSLHRVAQLLDAVVSKHKDNLTDAQYMQLPEWPAIVAAARATLAEFDKP